MFGKDGLMEITTYSVIEESSAVETGGNCTDQHSHFFRVLNLGPI